jgi:hypothetical protein
VIGFSIFNSLAIKAVGTSGSHGKDESLVVEAWQCIPTNYRSLGHAGTCPIKKGSTSIKR